MTAVVSPRRRGAKSARHYALSLIRTQGQRELLQHRRERLTGYQVPKHLEFRPSLPKANVGKILRRALLEEQLARAR